MPASSDSVKVAVRVRPFNQREEKAGSRCILDMKDKTTVITNPASGDKKTFSYDHSYWSHNGFRETSEGVNEPDTGGNPYASQHQVFKDLGQGVLDNAWQGYNAALFAYGQTGSGKSYSMIGYGANKGIVPITCEELFKAIEGKGDKKQFQVSFSILEIYNEQVRDLLVKAKAPHGGLKVRQNPKSGFYVEGLKLVPVRNYKEIEKLMESGTINRTTASTNMNATSSRSHMVITIKFEQVIMNATGQSNTRSSDINLVDLAGSERADSTGATGDRLKEGSAINQSLSTLGNVISALADQASGKKKVLVPYRDSVLTKLLQSALGGNSRTIMIAALSPADINYDETLSTLRYADRAKQIQNKAVVNESPTDRLIRELKEENAKLLAMLKKQGGSDTSDEHTTDIQRMLEENQKKMGDMQLSWEQRLEQARHEWERSHKSDTHVDELQWKQFPYFTNINEDPQLSGVIKHGITKDRTIIGRAGSSNVSIEIRGLGIQEQHAEVVSDGRHVHINPCSPTTHLVINGLPIKQKTKLNNLDRLKLGSSSMFLYVGFPSERKDESQLSRYDFDFFMTELAEHEGVSVDITSPREQTHDSADAHNKLLFRDFIDLMPKVTEANAISEELKKNIHFEPLVKSASSHDPKGEATEKEVMIKVTDTKLKKVWVWSKLKFMNRKDLMDELYLKHLDGDSVILSRDKDPFWDPVEDIFLGSCHVMLKSISYCTEIDEHFTLHNYSGKEEAVMRVHIQPCDKQWKPKGEDFILEPQDLLSKPLFLRVALPECMSVRWITEDHSRGIFCKFSLYKQKSMQTKDVWHKSYVEFDYQQQVTYQKVTTELLDYFHQNAVVIELWGKQVSEDAQLHQFVPATSVKPKEVKTKQPRIVKKKSDTGDLLTQLKTRESEVEQLSQELEVSRKDNFNLRKDHMKTKERLQLMEIRRENTMVRRTSIDKAATERRILSQSSPVVRTNDNKASGGLDVELAKSLREFFHDIRDVQSGIKDMRTCVCTLKEKVGGNGIHTSVAQHEQNLIDVDEKLMSCVNLLKKSAASALKRSKEH